MRLADASAGGWGWLGGDERDGNVEPLIGRESDVAFIASFVAGISSAGNALLLVGEPGVDKSALLDEAAQLAEGRGFRVLRAAGVEFEADVGFSALNQLVHPLFEDFLTLELWQREALTTALGLGPG
jgi:AAA ATPase domain